MTRYRAIVAYDGGGYAGFQRQRNAPSIQTALETALNAVLQVETPIVGAGRTDTGVHATGQVIAFEAEWSHGEVALRTALNLALPDDVVIQSVMVCDPDFHPRYDALARRYRYDVMVGDTPHPLMRRYAWHLPHTLSLEALNDASQVLLGKHDFATFGKPPKGENTFREVFLSRWEIREGQFGAVYAYHVEATAFLHHMVRRMVRMLVDVGRGWHSIASFEQAFRQANLKYAGKIAPPQGLVLVEVRYPPPHTNEHNALGKGG